MNRNRSSAASCALAVGIALGCLTTTATAQWWHPRNLGPDVNGPGNEVGPFVFGDQLLFSSDRIGGLGGYDIYMSFHEGDGWGEPLNVEPLNSDANERAPSLACVFDAPQVVFGSDRTGNYDVWWSQNRARCPDAPPEAWDRIEDLPVNWPGFDSMPALTADGMTLYFGSDRPGGFGGYDIYVSHQTDDGWSDPVNLGPIVNTEANEAGPSVSEDGLTLYFSSNRLGGFGGIDLYRSENDGGLWGPPENLGPDINTDSNETCGQEAGDEFYFRSDRPEGFGGGDLYVATRNSCRGTEEFKKALCKTRHGAVKKVIVVVKHGTPNALYVCTLDTGESLTRRANRRGKVKFKFAGDDAPPCGRNGAVVCDIGVNFDCGC